MFPQGSPVPPPSLFIGLRMRFAPNANVIPTPFLNLLQHRMDHLQSLASQAIMSSIYQLSPSELVEEACSVFTSRYAPLMNTTPQQLLTYDVD